MSTTRSGTKHAENEGQEVPGLNQTVVTIPSSCDGTEQPAIVQVPEGYDGSRPTPLLVGLHTWGGDYTQQRNRMGKPAHDRGWLMVLPQFRGPNRSINPDAPKACASLYAQHDIVDAVNYMVENYSVDQRRIYLLGASGGGHMAMIMAAKYPEIWAGVSAWVGLTDLVEFYARSSRDSSRNVFARDLEAICGGTPGSSAEVDYEYLRRSPIHFIRNALHVNLDIQAGARDPNRDQSERAYGRLASVGAACARLTLFDGGHEIHEEEAFDWLDRQVLDPAPPDRLVLTTDESRSYYFVDLEVADPMRLARCSLRVLSPAELELSTGSLKSLTVHIHRSNLNPSRELDIRIKAIDAPLVLRIEGLDKVNDIVGVEVASPAWRLQEGQIVVDVAKPGHYRIELGGKDLR